MNYLDLLYYLATHPIESFVIVLIQFIVVMKIHHKAHNKWLHYALAAWFLPQDFVVNVVLFSLIGIERPKEWTVTARLKRWKATGDNDRLSRWRFRVGWWCCDLLNKFDMGHC